MGYTTTEELVQWAEKELGHDLSGASSQRSAILDHLDRAHKLVCAGGGFLNFDEAGKQLSADRVFAFARSKQPAIINLSAAITTGNVTATQGSTTITFGAAPGGSNSVANWFIRVNDQDEVYRISAHTAAATTATLDGAFVGANVSAGTLKLWCLQYDIGLGTILRLIGPFRAQGSDNGDTISVYDKEEMLDNWPLDDIDTAYPEACSVIKESSGTISLQFNSAPDNLSRVEYDYVATPSTLVVSPAVDPILPKQFRLLLAELAVYHMMLRNDDTRAAQHLVNARNYFAELCDYNDKLNMGGDDDYGRIKVSGLEKFKGIDTVKGFEES